MHEQCSAGFDALQPYLSEKFLLETLTELIKTPTDVPLGAETLIAPDHPKLVHYVQNVVRPLMVKAGILNIVEAPKNQIVVREGSGEKSDSLLIMAYTPSQHQNFTKDPFTPRVAIPFEHGYTEPCIFGQGVSQNKVHQAAMITVLRAIAESGTKLRGTLYFGINNEGRSSHECSDALIPTLSPKPTHGIVLVGTGFDVSVGNRGRVDVYVHIHGKPTHSSTPWNGLNAIEGANEAINRIRNMKFSKTHPLLGGQHASVYQVVYHPMAPHTLPGYAKLTIDRRLLPGDDIDLAVAEMREAIGDLSPFKVEVVRGVHMLPALVDPDSPVVQRLAAATLSVRGQAPALRYQPGSYDAGGPCAHGIPTVQWGASGGHGLLGDDFVPLKSAWEEVLVLAKLIMEWLA